MTKKKVIYLTREGYERLKSELDTLRKKLMYEIAERIKEARELGDLSENSEYDEAKNEQGRIDSRIKQIEDTLNNSEIIEETGDHSVVKLGSRISLVNVDSKAVSEMVIVNSQEANIFEKRVSADSPVGRAALSRRVGDVLRVKTPSGWAKYKILSIS